MSARSLILLTVFGLLLAFNAGPALAQDIEACFATADRVADVVERVGGGSRTGGP